jgi:hypothetical protein
MHLSERSAWVRLAGLLILPAALSAATITYTTPTGSTTGGGAVNASAAFASSTGQLTLTLSDLQANPTDVAQLISDLQFTLTGVTGTIALSSSSAQQVTISNSGTATTGTTASTGWGFGTFGSGYLLCVVCQGSITSGATPSHLIIGPGPYTNANGSIAGNAPHNPFLNQTATFTFTGSGITSSTNVSSVIFSFGTTPGINVTGTPGTPGGGGGSAVPEPGTCITMGLSLIAVGAFKRKLLKARA